MTKVLYFFVLLTFISPLAAQKWIQQAPNPLNQELKLDQFTWLNEIYFLDSLNGWASTGDIYRTRDGGGTWFPVANDLIRNMMHLGQLQFVDTTNGFAVSQSQDYFYITTDGGRNWGQRRIDDIDIISYFHFTDRFHGFVFGYTSFDFQKNNGFYFQTTDGGNSFRCDSSFSKLNKSISKICFINTNIGFVHTLDNLVYKTTNGGIVWEHIFTTNTSSKAEFAYADVQNVWLSDGRFTYRTSDGGITWRYILTVDSLAYKDKFHAIVIDSITAVATCTEGILKTTDGGLHWNMKRYLPYEHVYAPTFTNKQNGWVSQRFSLFHTTDAGDTWDCTSNGLALDVRDVFFFDNNYGITVGEYTNIQTTTNGGARWIPSNSLLNMGYQSFSKVIPKNFTSVWVTGISGFQNSPTLLTTDKGFTWQQFPFKAREIYNLDNINVWMSMDSGIVMRSYDGGDTWQEITRIPWDTTIWNSTNIVELNEITFTDTLNGYAIGGTSYNTQRLYKTTDGGVHWDTLTVNSRDKLLKKVEFFNRDVGYVMSQDELYRTSDGGLTWKIDSAGYYMNRSSYRYDIQMKRNGEGWINSSGGIFYTPNKGKTWEILCKYSLANKLFFVDRNTGWAVGNEGFIYKYIGDTLASSVAPYPLENSLLTLYPIPTDDILFIHLTDEYHSPIVLTCFDVLGNSISPSVITSGLYNDYSIDTSQLPSGVYTIIIQAEGLHSSGRFVVTR
ncbi:MAG: YCF48-related protein [Candidatus Kapaibacterium sp.]|nr:T9SS type A sorting domain-containing protein [Bacteroidota bacterium]